MQHMDGGWPTLVFSFFRSATIMGAPSFERFLLEGWERIRVVWCPPTLDAMKPRQGWGTLGGGKRDDEKTRVGHPPELRSHHDI